MPTDEMIRGIRLELFSRRAQTSNETGFACRRPPRLQRAQIAQRVDVVPVVVIIALLLLRLPLLPLEKTPGVAPRLCLTRPLPERTPLQQWGMPPRLDGLGGRGYGTLSRLHRGYGPSNAAERL